MVMIIWNTISIVTIQVVHNGVYRCKEDANHIQF